jgi:hypothetical protein
MAQPSRIKSIDMKTRRKKWRSLVVMNRKEKKIGAA